MKKLLLTLTLSVLSITLIAQISPKEKQALVDFYLATNGENWVNTWDINDAAANWHGITVENNQVTGISLLFNNMEGNIPSSIGNLANLKSLELSFNKLNGTIPSEIGKLSKLELLALNGNNLNGKIPSSIGDLSALKELHLSSNKLNGVIPTPIGNLAKLEILNVFDNELSGTLPIGLSYSENLKKLVVAENELIETEAYSTLLLFNNDPSFKPNNSLLPSAKTVIAIETSDDN